MYIRVNHLEAILWFKQLIFNQSTAVSASIFQMKEIIYTIIKKIMDIPILF